MLSCANGSLHGSQAPTSIRSSPGAVTVANSRRWSDFEDYLIPRDRWELDRGRQYTVLGLPMDVDSYVRRLNEHLSAVTARVDKRVTSNQALTIDADKGEFHLAALKGRDTPDEVKGLKKLIESRLPRIDLVDILIDLDNETNFLRHFLHHHGPETKLSPAAQRRNVLAALIAVGCNIGPLRMSAASPGISFREISHVADWYFTEEILKAASIDLVNYASRLPLEPAIWSGGYLLRGWNAILRARQHPGRRLQPFVARPGSNTLFPHRRQLFAPSPETGALPLARGAVQSRRADGA